jgi:hypothetical protein
MDYFQYKTIRSGKPIPQPVINAIKDEKLQLPEGSIVIRMDARCRDLRRELKFNMDTKLSEIEKFLDTIRVKFYEDGYHLHPVNERGISIQVRNAEGKTLIHTNLSKIQDIQEVSFIVTHIKNVL